MDKAQSQLLEALKAVGLQNMGTCRVEPNDGLVGQTIMLIGPDEPRFWDIFTASEHYNDGEPNPLDRWSVAVLDSIAKAANGHAIYPFGGPPYHPFHSWALRSGQSWSSPIGFLVHRTAGLFASYRGALLLPWETQGRLMTSPCMTCTDQPCRSACPVDAFSDGYAVDTCKSYLHSPEGQNCMTQGCAARRACPVGQGLRQPAQAAFHMEAFL
ncbi:MAG: ferredoxin [Pseudomonadota bacterium]